MQTVDIDGVKINYFQELNNSKPNFVFIHGFNSNLSFVSSLKHLIRRYNIIVFDFPGAGKSDKLDNISLKDYANITSKIIREFNLKNITIVSHSLGSYVALEMRKRLNVKNVVLISPFNPYQFDDEKVLSKKQLRNWLLPETMENAIDSYTKLVKNPNRKHYFENIEKTATLFLPNIEKIKKSFTKMVDTEILDDNFLTTELLERYKSSKVDLIITGDSDNFTPLKSVQKIIDEFNIQSEVFKDCGHAPIFEYPIIINRIFNDLAVDKYKNKEERKADDIDRHNKILEDNKPKSQITPNELRAAEREKAREDFLRSQQEHMMGGSLEQIHHKKPTTKK